MNPNTEAEVRRLEDELHELLAVHLRLLVFEKKESIDPNIRKATDEMSRYIVTKLRQTLTRLTQLEREDS